MGTAVDGVVAVAKGRLDGYAYGAGWVGVGILVEQRLVAFHGPLGIQQGDLAGFFGEDRPRVALHAVEQSAFPQGGHELSYVTGIGLDALCDLLTGEAGIRVQCNKGQNVYSVAELGGVFHCKIPFFLMLVLL